MDVTPGADDVAQCVALEQALLEPATRADPQLVTELLADDFCELGASGRVWDRGAIVASLRASPGVSGVVRDLSAGTVGDGVVLVTYRLDGPAPSLRSSLWVRDAGRWRLRFHQGTPVPGTV